MWIEPCLEAKIQNWNFTSRGKRINKVSWYKSLIFYGIKVRTKILVFCRFDSLELGERIFLNNIPPFTWKCFHFEIYKYSMKLTEISKDCTILNRIKFWILTNIITERWRLSEGVSIPEYYNMLGLCVYIVVPSAIDVVIWVAEFQNSRIHLVTRIQNYEKCEWNVKITAISLFDLIITNFYYIYHL